MGGGQLLRLEEGKVVSGPDPYVGKTNVKDSVLDGEGAGLPRMVELTTTTLVSVTLLGAACRCSRMRLERPHIYTLFRVSVEKTDDEAKRPLAGLTWGNAAAGTHNSDPKIADRRVSAVFILVDPGN